MVSTSEALTGPWATNLRGWLAAVPLGAVVVVVQELATPVPPGAWIAGSIVLQLVASTAWVLPIVGISRRLTGRVAPVALGLLWIGVGVVRGVVSAAVAMSVGAPPEWGYRIGFWVVASVCWMPLLTYALAQWDEHRRLLAERAALATALDHAAALAAEGDESRTRRLTTAASDALGPALDEIRAALRGGRAAVDPQVARTIAARLDELSARTAAFSSPSSVTPPPRYPRRVTVRAASREFELRRPVFAAFLTAADTAPLLLPEAFREGGWPGVAEMAVAILVATVALVAAFGVLRPRRFSGAQRSLASRVGVIVAGLLGAAVLAGLTWQSPGARDLLLVAAFPVVIALGASATATAVALESTNADLLSRIALKQSALADLDERVRAADDDAARRLNTLVRGQLNGRLAACAMTLAFLVSGDVPPEAHDAAIAGVLDQLDAAAAELAPA